MSIRLLPAMKPPHLTNYELEFMDVLWRKGEGTVQTVCDELKRPLAYTTVLTTLGLLYSKKKVLKRSRRGRAHVYQPTISREEVSRTVLDDLQDVLFADRFPSLVLAMFKDGRFSEKDIKALKAALRKVEKKE